MLNGGGHVSAEIKDNTTPEMAAKTRGLSCDWEQNRSIVSFLQGFWEPQFLAPPWRITTKKTAFQSSFNTTKYANDDKFETRCWMTIHASVTAMAEQTVVQR